MQSLSASTFSAAFPGNDGNIWIPQTHTHTHTHTERRAVVALVALVHCMLAPVVRPRPELLPAYTKQNTQ